MADLLEKQLSPSGARPALTSGRRQGSVRAPAANGRSAARGGRSLRTPVVVVLLVLIGGGVGLALGALFRGPATVRVNVLPSGPAIADRSVLATTAGPLERRLEDWRLLGARVSREPLAGGGLALTLQSPWWGPSPRAVQARVASAVEGFVEQQAHNDAETVRTIVDLESQRLDLQADHEWLLSTVNENVAAFVAMVRNERDVLQQQIEKTEQHVLAEQQALSVMLMRWNEYRQPVDKLSLVGLQNEIRAAEQRDAMLSADRQALADARNEAKQIMLEQLAAIEPAASRLLQEIDTFVADASALAERSEDLKTSAQRIIASLTELREATATLIGDAQTLQADVGQLEGMHIALELRSIQRSAYDAGDTWLIARDSSKERLETLIDDLPRDAAHRTPALVAQSRYQRMFAQLSSSLVSVHSAVRSMDTEFNRPMDGAFRRLLGLNQRVEQRAAAIREGIEQRLMAEAESTRQAELERIESQLEPKSDRIRELTVELAARQSNRDDLTVVLERATAAQAAQDKRLAEASAIARQIDSVNEMVNRRLASWSPPPVVTIDAAVAKDVPTQARLGTAAMISGSAFVLVIVVLMANGVVARFGRRRARDDMGSF